MHHCADCGRETDYEGEDGRLCEDCERAHNESQDKRRHEGDAEHKK